MAVRAVSTLAALLAFAAAPLAAQAVDSAAFGFDTTTDPGDLADGPVYDVTGVNPIDDGSGCDAAAMVMVDATGTPTDVDSFCLDLVTGLGGSDGDYGLFGTGYVPVIGPVTYALFDLTADDLAALTGFGDTTQEYFDYVVANARFMGEQTFDVPAPIPNDGPPFSLAPGMQCYQVKDRTDPKLPKILSSAWPIRSPRARSRSRSSRTTACRSARAAPRPGICCYKAKGQKLGMRPIIETATGSASARSRSRRRS